MAILSVKEQAHQRTASESTANLGDSVRLFQVKTDDGGDETECAAAVDPVTGVAVPLLYDSHPTRAFLFCSSKGYRWVDGQQGLVCEVTCSYTAISGLLPWQEPPVYSWSGVPAEQIMDVDLNGTDIRNSTKQPFDPAITAQRPDPCMTVTRNELSPTAFLWTGSVNSTTFYGAAPGYCMLTVSGQQQTYQDQTTSVQTQYWAMTYQFQFKNPLTPGWQAKVLDAGYCQLGTSGNPVPILIGGRELSSPAPLDGSGHALSPSGTPVYLNFTIYPTNDFNSLGL